jgi:hypothetical protein
VTLPTRAQAIAERIGREAGERARVWRTFDERVAGARQGWPALRAMDPAKAAWVRGQLGRAEEYAQAIAISLGLDPAEALRRFRSGVGRV